MPISIPTFIIKPFAANGDVNVIPLDPSTTVGAASFELGYPPANSLDQTAGGVPPARRDTNAILKLLSSNIAFLTGGGGFPFDQDFSDENGGYFEGAVLKSATDSTKWFYNRSDGNTNDPDVDVSGWTSFSLIASPTEVQTLVLPAGTTNGLVVGDGVGLVNLDSSAGAAVITDAVPQFDGQIIVLRNSGANIVTLTANDGARPAANRWRLPANLGLLANQTKSFKNFAGLPGWVAL